MRSRTTRQFRQQLKTLPDAIQRQAKAAYQRFEADPWNQSLRFKQVHPSQPIYSVRLAKGYRIRELMERSANLPMALADASLVVAATELGDGRILSTAQRDFDTYRWKDTQPFHNLLRPFAADAG